MAACWTLKLALAFFYRDVASVGDAPDGRRVATAFMPGWVRGVA